MSVTTNNSSACGRNAAMTDQIQNVGEQLENTEIENIASGYCE